VLHEATGTGEYKLADGLLVQAEDRRDWSNGVPSRAALAHRISERTRTPPDRGVWWFGNKSGTW
jgi:hypothetical protein